MTLWGGGVSWHSQAPAILTHPTLVQMASNTLLHLVQPEQPTPAGPAPEEALGVPWQSL